MRISDKIKELRQNRCMTQTQLALQSGLSRQYIECLEKGAVIAPRIDTLRDLSVALRTTIDGLIEGVDFSR